MSAESQPISAERFALAIQDLPAENLYSKAQEIENSIAHLERSNRQLQEYIDSIRSDTSLSESTRQEGDKDCSDAIQENHIVIERQKERVELLKREVERRGGKWHEADTNGKLNGAPEEAATSSTETERIAGGRLTDEELRRQMMDRLGGGDDDDDNEDGMHL
ncbi:uncharacterized protein A1O5_08509 [Cladophialophora psammophila CBS 110553]|uniref:Uncharacterized protein n=1 Tax=Cladophialophora psammophila CBS 110553 TaxID=1182543 RepID=W9WUI8_9EURO|nr:uncharacterized protein A1O5_08509 [Cladophialophora psammophila CBS 110553]EXJ68715.1 hypothetical protein A1O5_08509 [Cladophialophora psammophila CBS 110553]